MKTPWLILIILVLINPPFVMAEGEPTVQNTDTHQSINSIAPSATRGGSVYRINPAIDYPLLGVAALGASVPLLFESKLINNKCPCNPNEVNSFDRPVIGNHNKTAGMISHYTVALAMVTPIVFDAADQGFNKTLGEDFLVYIEVLSIDTALSHIARYGAQRPRPTAYEADPPETRAGEFLSFYSGHTASVFAGLSAASMTYGYRYGHKAWPWLLTIGAGVGESALRVAAGRHFYTDVIAGAVMGTAVGIIVPYLHRRYTNSDSSLMLLPTRDKYGLQLVWQKKF